MRKKKPGSLTDLQNYFMKAEAGKKLTPQGDGRYDIGTEFGSTLPKTGKKPQTPAQHAAVKKAAAVSRRNRKINAGLPIIGTKAKIGF